MAFSSFQVEELLAGTRKVKSEQAKVFINNSPHSYIQHIQDIFDEVAGVRSVTMTKEGYLLNRISNSCDFGKLILERVDLISRRGIFLK